MINADSRLEALHARYRSSLPGKRASLELAWHALRTDPNGPEKFEALRRLIHRLAGSAPTYDLVEVGRAAVRANAVLDKSRSAFDGNTQAARAASLAQVSVQIERLLQVLDEETPGGS